MKLLQGDAFVSLAVLVRQLWAEFAATAHQFRRLHRSIELYRLDCPFAPSLLVITAWSRRLDGGRFAMALGMTALHPTADHLSGGA